MKMWKWTKAQIIGCIIIGFFIIAVPAVLLPITWKIATQRQIQKQVGEIKGQGYEIGSVVPIGSTIVKITDCKKMSEWQQYAPAGFSILLVSYEKEKLDDNLFEFESEVYMKLPTEEYIEPVNEYRLAEELGMDVEQLTEHYGVMDEFRENTGSFAFLVPDSMERAEVVIYYIPDRNGTAVLDSVYEIAVDWREP